MPYKLGKIWNEASTYITTDKKVGINTSYPTSTLDVKGDITEDGLKLSKKYTLKTDDNKKEDLIILDNRDNLIDNYKNNLILWYKFNEDNFTTNEGKADNIELIPRETLPYHKSNYIIGTNSAKIDTDLYYEINFEYSSKFLTFSQHTICFWIFLNDISNKTIINSFKNDSHNFKLVLDNEKLKYFIYDEIVGQLPLNANNVITNTIFKVNQWYHITLTIDMNNPINEELVIYINGIKDISSNFKKESQQSSDFIINRENVTPTIYLGYNTESFNGYIDDFRIYEGIIIPLSTIQQEIIGNFTRIIPGNINSLGNYGIDIVNFSNLVTIGNTNNPVDLQVYGDLILDSLNLTSNNVITSYIDYLTVTSNITINTDLTVENSITENNQQLINKYALKADVDKNTDVIISKMINDNDVKTLYNKLPEFFREKVLIEYNFDFDKDNIKDFNYFKQNSSTNPLKDTIEKYSNFANVDLQSSKDIEIDDYGEKYVKGRSSLKCYSNIEPLFYYFDTVQLTNNRNYTITLWVRFNQLNTLQNIFKIGDDYYFNLYLNSDNKLVFNKYISSSIELEIDKELKKDEWYHITIILLNESTTIDTTNISDIEIIEQYKSYNYVNYYEHSYLKISSLDKLCIYVYINGIQQNIKKDDIIYQKYEYGIGTNLFKDENNMRNYIGVYSKFNENQNTNIKDILNGYIDDFKIYDEVIPIKFINENIIGNALILTPGKLSAIGNYGIDIKNFESLVSIGNNENIVDLDIYGVLTISSGKIISASNNLLETSNLTITDTLTTNCNISSNINLLDTIIGPDFILGTDNYIKTLKKPNDHKPRPIL